MSLPYRQGLIILGMHRSGTSALAGAAVRLGLAGPRSGLPASADNPAGFYEPRKIVALNHHILAASGCSWNICLSLWPERLPARLALGDRQLIFKNLYSEFGDDRSFVLKDPRLCVTLPAWLPALQLNGAALRVMVLLRHPAEVMQSLAARNKLPPAESMTNWLHHMLEAERVSRRMNRAFVMYDRLLADWQGALTQAAQQSGMVWPRRLAQAAPEIAAFLQSEARHYAIASHVTLHGNAPVDEWVNAAWASLQKLVANPRDEAAMGVLDQVWTRFADYRNTVMPEGTVVPFAEGQLAG